MKPLDGIADSLYPGEHFIGDLKMELVLRGEHQRDHPKRIEPKALERRVRKHLARVDLVVLRGDYPDYTVGKFAICNTNGLCVEQFANPPLALENVKQSRAIAKLGNH